MSRFAYVLMTYRNPGQVLRLVRRLRVLSPTALVLVRHDARATAVAAEEVRDTGAVLHEYTTPIDWGGWSMVAAQIRELRWLREHTAVTHVSFLSGQDYPIAPLGPFEERVLGAGADLWGQVRPVSYRPRWLGRGRGDHRARRALYRYTRVRSGLEPRGVRLLEPLLDAQRLPHSRDLFVGVRQPQRGVQVWWGLPWLTLSARAVDAVLRADAGSAVKQLLRHTLIPEESFIPTVVGNDRTLRIVEAELTHCRFPGHVWHPVTFTREHLEELASVSAPFARKFDEGVDAGVLDALDGA